MRWAEMMPESTVLKRKRPLQALAGLMFLGAGFLVFLLLGLRVWENVSISLAARRHMQQLITIESVNHDWFGKRPSVRISQIEKTDALAVVTAHISDQSSGFSAKLLLSHDPQEGWQVTGVQSIQSGFREISQPEPRLQDVIR
ncbi:MAG: hypothetical protein KDA78_00240, partial [Planctomycetaceae bacterium]|nr:hypothetical protein [Planctomycetaceae bacterium]